MKANAVYSRLVSCAAFLNAREDHRAEITGMVCSLIAEAVAEDRALWSRTEATQPPAAPSDAPQGCPTWEQCRQHCCHGACLPKGQS